ncbi:hypothetical protein JIN77_15920 [Verrucomicrobiaceae bacterium R5-34]|uniref:Uncharacterized protein n=1 Tax=Oceaniferula flava TaxID=2800421 RepID=A0AAE2SGB9_9BACT|nr:hypothetical protein [Oceaniferula flavus]MBK1832226.1 hypothetical protein [Verrucomicrobiaceae bacterium R5-34]MBK1855876.1 hypothetical protein [Oceaniferula flavus]MBM1137183.1 hypothetical protein [Oceaniferula flavus]
MSKKTDNTLLIPGPDGWEIWQGTREQGFRQTLADGPAEAAELENIPKGRLIMAFPVRQALAVPFKVQTEDEAMFEDLAAMHLEKIGVRPDVEAGRLTDVFNAGQEEGQTTLLNVVLAAPEEGTMPPSAPGLFDLSPRFFPLPANGVTLWRELGRWVFAISSNGHLTYFQSLAGSQLGNDAVRDIRLALSQLSLQGVTLHTDHATVWTTGSPADPSDQAVRDLGKALGAEISSEPKPQPLLPEKISQLVPADVRAEQRLQAERQKRNLIIGAVALVYLGLVGYFALQYIDLNKQLKAQQKELAQINLMHGDIGLFYQDWEDLSAMVDDRHWPLNALMRSSELIPPNQIKDLRFKVFEATPERVYISGESTEIKQASAFGEKLKRSLGEYDWKAPNIGADAKTNRWKFTFEGILEGSEMEQ